MKKKILGRLTAFLLTGALLPAFPVSAAKSESYHIVALGDGIVSGEGLDDTAESFTWAGAAHCRAALDIVHADTAAELTEQLENASVKALLEDADMIIVSAGMQDALSPFFAKVEAYQAQYGFADLQDLFTAKLEDYNLTEDDLYDVSNEFGNAARENKNTAIESLTKLGGQLEAYSDAKIIYVNCFNPLDNLVNYDSLSDKRQFAYDTIKNPVRAVLNGTAAATSTSLNQTIQANADAVGGTVLDVYSLFVGKAYEYSYLPQMSTLPSAAGHALLADALLPMIDQELGAVPGDVDGNGEINAADAAYILQYAASVGSGQGETLDVRGRAAANVSSYALYDENIDAMDAAYLLQYAAASGVGETVTFKELVQR